MIAVPDDAVEERFLAATGPGGQNVNKVATACQLRVDVFRLGLHPETYQRLKALAGSRLTAGGVLVITARRFRTQDGNRQDAREALDIAARGKVKCHYSVKPLSELSQCVHTLHRFSIMDGVADLIRACAGPTRRSSRARSRAALSST